MKQKIKINKELKKSMSFTVKPSNVVKARRKAAKDGKSLSVVVDDFLYDYSAE